MRGSIRRRGAAWWVVVDAGQDPVTGRRRQITRTVHGTKNDAEDVLNGLIGEIRTGHGHGHDGTMGELIDRWFQMATLSPAARSDYASAIRKHIPAPLRAMPVWRVRAHDLDALYAHLISSGLGAARVRRVHNILSAALKQGVRWQWIARNPAVDASPPAVRRAQPRVPSVEEVRRLLDAADDDLSVYLRLSANLGARRGEVCALGWVDVDLDARQITIRHAWSDGGRGVGLVLKGTKTDRERTVALDRATASMLASWRRRLTEKAFELGGRPGPWLFPAEPYDGTFAVRPDTMTHRFADLRATLGLEHVQMKHLRHFVATVLLAAGHDPKTVSTRLGHARTSTTLDIYAAFVPARDQDAADELGRLLG